MNGLPDFDIIFQNFKPLFSCFIKKHYQAVKADTQTGDNESASCFQFSNKQITFIFIGLVISKLPILTVVVFLKIVVNLIFVQSYKYAINLIALYTGTQWDEMRVFMGMDAELVEEVKMTYYFLILCQNANLKSGL